MNLFKVSGKDYHFQFNTEFLENFTDFFSKVRSNEESFDLFEDLAITEQQSKDWASKIVSSSYGEDFVKALFGETSNGYKEVIFTREEILITIKVLEHLKQNAHIDYLLKAASGYLEISRSNKLVKLPFITVDEVINSEETFEEVKLNGVLLQKKVIQHEGNNVYYLLATREDDNRKAFMKTSENSDLKKTYDQNIQKLKIQF